MWHTVFIALHAVAGGTALVAGCIAIQHGAYFGTYLWSMTAMELFLLAAIAAEWTRNELSVRTLFIALAALGAFMVWRAVAARKVLPSGSAPPPASYVDHVGFTLVALLDAFVIITVLNAGAPPRLVAAVGVLIGVSGHFVLMSVRDHLCRH